MCTVGFIVGSIIPNRAKCIHSATKKLRRPNRLVVFFEGLQAQMVKTSHVVERLDAKTCLDHVGVLGLISDVAHVFLEAPPRIPS